MMRSFKITIILAVLILTSGLFVFFKNRSNDLFDASKKNMNYKEEVQVKGVSDENIPIEKLRILFVGDLMLDRYIRQVTEKKGKDFIFDDIGGFLKSYDLVVANLEGPITENASLSINSKEGEKNNYYFTFPPDSADLLYGKNIKLVNIGNNHILNFGEAGYAETKERLKKSGVKYFGDTGFSGDNFYVYLINGTRFAFVSYNQFTSKSGIRTLEAIKNLKNKSDFIIIFSHWDKEYFSEPMESTKILSREFVDAGADLIIGSHPHVIQSKEIYKGKLIYYSLGNFIFDQYFSPETQKGLAVEAEFDPTSKNIDFSEYPLKLKNNGQTIIKK